MSLLPLDGYLLLAAAKDNKGWNHNKDHHHDHTIPQVVGDHHSSLVEDRFKALLYQVVIQYASYDAVSGT